MKKKIHNYLCSSNFCLIEDYLGVKNLSFHDDICGELKTYYGKHIKRQGVGWYRKEDKVSYSFPKNIKVFFTIKNKKFGLIVDTEKFIFSYDYNYDKFDTVDCGDGLIEVEKNLFGGKKPMLLPYTFVGNGYKLDNIKFVNYLKEKINLT